LIQKKEAVTAAKPGTEGIQWFAVSCPTSSAVAATTQQHATSHKRPPFAAAAHGNTAAIRRQRRTQNARRTNAASGGRYANGQERTAWQEYEQNSHRFEIRGPVSLRSTRPPALKSRNVHATFTAGPAYIIRTREQRYRHNAEYNRQCLRQEGKERLSFACRWHSKEGRRGNAVPGSVP